MAMCQKQLQAAETLKPGVKAEIGVCGFECVETPQWPPHQMELKGHFLRERLSVSTWGRDFFPQEKWVQ